MRPFASAVNALIGVSNIIRSTNAESAAAVPSLVADARPTGGVAVMNRAVRVLVTATRTRAIRLMMSSFLGGSVDRCEGSSDTDSTVLRCRRQPELGQ